MGAIMIKKILVRSIKMTLIGLMGMSIIVLDANPSFAEKGGGCGPGCHNRLCQDLVKQKGLKGDEFKAEFNKCKADPASYK
jgi:hypothetical protein